MALIAAERRGCRTSLKSGATETPAQNDFAWQDYGLVVQAHGSNSERVASKGTMKMVVSMYSVVGPKGPLKHKRE